MHPQASNVTMGRQHPQAKATAAVVLPLDPIFFTVPFFSACFLVSAIFQASFSRSLPLFTALIIFDVFRGDLIQDLVLESQIRAERARRFVLPMAATG